MGEKFDFLAARDADGCALQIWIHGPDLVGKSARVLVTQRAKVKRGSPVHKQHEVFTHTLTLAPGQNRVHLGNALDDLFTYTGTQLDLELIATLTIDDGVFRDTSIDLDLSRVCLLPPRAEPAAHAASIHSPTDRFSFIANLRAIPAAARAKVLALLILGGPLLLANLLVGTHDEFVPESRSWFYDQTGSDGDSENPIMKALIGSGALGIALWAMIRAQLGRYMRFEAKRPHTDAGYDTRWQPAAFISGQARVPLQGATLRVVAYNREHGQYTAQEKNGKSTRTVTRNFASDACGVVLYERLLAYVPAQSPLASFLDGDAELRPVFETLYPPVMLGDHHGLSVEFEVQLLHPEYVDHEVVFDRVTLDPADFHRTG